MKFKEGDIVKFTGNYNNVPKIHRVLKGYSIYYNRVSDGKRDWYISDFAEKVTKEDFYDKYIRVDNHEQSVKVQKLLFSYYYFFSVSTRK